MFNMPSSCRGFGFLVLMVALMSSGCSLKNDSLRETAQEEGVGNILYISAIAFIPSGLRYANDDEVYSSASIQLEIVSGEMDVANINSLEFSLAGESEDLEKLSCQNGYSISSENLDKLTSEFVDKLRTQVADDTASKNIDCLLYTSPSPRDATLSRMPSSA